MCTVKPTPLYIFHITAVSSSPTTPQVSCYAPDSSWIRHQLHMEFMHSDFPFCAHLTIYSYTENIAKGALPVDDYALKVLSRMTTKFDRLGWSFCICSEKHNTRNLYMVSLF